MHIQDMFHRYKEAAVARLGALLAARPLWWLKNSDNEVPAALSKTIGHVFTA